MIMASKAALKGGPDIAVIAHVGGVVILEALDAEGNVEAVKVLRSIKLLNGQR